MFKMTLRSVFSNKIRFLLTALSVVLGVAFVVSAFVVTDGLRSTFSDLSADIYSQQDLTVRPAAPFGERDGDLPPVPDQVLADVAALDSVVEATPAIFAGEVLVVDDLGNEPETGGPPVVGVNWTGNDALDQFVLIDGVGPSSPTEIAIDVNTFADGDYTIGNEYVVKGPIATETFTLVGTIRFGVDEDVSVGARFTAFEAETAQRFLDRQDAWDEIALAIDGDIEAAQAEITALLPQGVEVVSGDVSQAEFNDSFNEFLGPFRTILLAFAFVILFVSAFLINNTFNIIVGQRIRELGLLRAIGATGSQVRRSVLVEALLVGLIATAIGLGLGLLGARGLIALLESQGGEFPDGPLPLAFRTILVALFTGVVVTVISAMIPARKASTISPMEALQETSSLAESSNARRSIIGAVLALVGIVATLVGLFGSFEDATPRLTILGFGAIVSFIAVAVLSPFLVRPVVGLIGAPIAGAFGAAGSMARRNSLRSPQRTAGTAVALTIGLALIATVTVLAASLKSTVTESLETRVNAGYVVFGELTDAQVGEVAALPGISETSVIGSGEVLLGDDFDTDEVVEAESVNFSDIEALVDTGLTGDYTPGGNHVVLEKNAAEDYGLGIGDDITLSFKNLNTEIFEVSGIYEYTDILDAPVIIDTTTFTTNFAEADAFVLLARGADDVTPAQARTQLDTVFDGDENFEVNDQAEYLESVDQEISSLLSIINIFLGLAVGIALIGIINTLTLSVFERTREIGLLRAVGMARRQARRMIRWESVLISVFGGILGIALGLLFGYALATAIPDSIISGVSFPVGSLITFVIMAIIAGFVAAIMPARRAAKLNILDAISHV